LWFYFRLESIFNTASAASKDTALFDSGQNQPKNSYLTLFIYLSKSVTRSVKATFGIWIIRGKERFQSAFLVIQNKTISVNIF
jgi:hypothetical protein